MTFEAPTPSRIIFGTFGLAGLLALSSCGMFYSKVGDRPGEGTDTSGKVGIVDVAVTEYSFSTAAQDEWEDEAAFLDSSDGEALATSRNAPLSYGITVAKGAKDVGFGHEFTMMSGKDKKVTGRIMFSPEGLAMVTLKTKGVTVSSTQCKENPNTSDTPTLETDDTLVEQLDTVELSGTDLDASYTCILAGKWTPGKAYKVGIVNTTADGAVIKIDGDGFDGNKGYLKLTAVKGMDLSPTVKAFTRSLKALTNCAALASGEAQFSTPTLGGKAATTKGSGGPIAACSEAIVITCTPTGCNHVISNPAEF